MKKLILIFTLLAIISCKKESQETNVVADKVDSLSTEIKPISTDTIYFSYDEKWKGKDFALVHLLDKKYNKDSVCTGTFKVDFKDKNWATIFSKILTIKGVVEGSEWDGYLELDTISSPLKMVSFGYPSCGYSQNHFLFYIDSKNSNLVHKWYSGTDSGWGTWSEVVSGKPEDFYFRTESFLQADEPKPGEDELGINEFSDSIHFKFENKKWKKTYLTPKGKVYRSKELRFSDFHHIN